MKRLEEICLALAVWSGMLFLFAPPAWAIPAFARRYGLSCSVCHDAWPHLNPAGQSFMMSGYRRLAGVTLQPTTKDIEIVKDVLSLPSVPPLAVVSNFGYEFQDVRRRAADGSLATRTGSSVDLDELDVLAGTPLGTHLSFFLAYDLFETEIERPTGPGEANETGNRNDITFETEGPRVPGLARLIWTSLLPESVAPPDSLNILGGINELPLAFSPEHRRLSASPYLVYERRALDFLSGTPVEDLLAGEDQRRRLFRLNKSQIGLEVNGVLAPGGGGTTARNRPMLEYHVGGTNGSNNDSDANREKDVFGRLALTWADQTLGVFGYYSSDIYSDGLRSDAAFVLPPTGTGIFSGVERPNRRWSVGPDLTLRAEPLDVPVWIEAQVLFNHEGSPTGFDTGFDWWGGFAQLNAKIVRSVVAYGRYDWLRGGHFNDTVAGGVTGPVRPREWAAVGGLQWYLLENFKLVGEYSRREFKNTASTPAEQKITENVFTIRASLGF